MDDDLDTLSTTLHARTDDPLKAKAARHEHGRGLVMVRALSARTCASGDHRGRLVWTEIPWTGEGAVALQSAEAYETAIRKEETAHSRRYAGVVIWFGRPPAMVGTTRREFCRAQASTWHCSS